MGVTIHFEGQLKDGNAFSNCMEKVREFAEQLKVELYDISSTSTTLSRVKDEKDWDYTGPTKGVELYPHEACEPLRFEFDENLYIQEYVKTQFAPQEIHKKIIELFHSLEAEFETLDICDEGEYWETSNMEILEGHIYNCANALADLIEKKNVKGPIRLESGRIIDFIS